MNQKSSPIQILKSVQRVLTSDRADMAQSVGVKRLLLSHFRIHMDDPAAHKMAMNDLSKRFEGPAAIVEDLDVFDI